MDEVQRNKEKARFMWDQCERAKQLLSVRGDVGLGVSILGVNALGFINDAIEKLAMAQNELRGKI